MTWLMIHRLILSISLVLALESVRVESQQSSGSTYKDAIAFVTGPTVTDSSKSSNLSIFDSTTAKQIQLTSNQSSSIYGSVSWSPDKRELAFSLWKDRSKTHGNFGNFNIFVMNLATSTIRQLTHGQDDDIPTWSPDGKRIAFVSIQNGYFGIYSISADGSDEHQLSRTQLAGAYRWLAWSPDGNQLAFILDNDASCPRIFTMDSNGTNIRQLTTECDGTSLSWSPDSKQLLFTKQDGQIYTLKLSNGAIKQITHQTTVFFSSPAWSSDGKHIAVVSTDLTKSLAAENIYLIDTDGNNMRQLTHNELDTHFYSLAW